MNKFIALFLVCMIAAAAFILFPSDEKKIRSNLDSLAEYCSTTGNDKAIAALTKVAMAGKLFYDPCMVEVNSFQLNKKLIRKEVTDSILAMKRMLPKTQFTFSDTDVLFPAEDRAEISTTLRLSGKALDNRFTDAYELNIISIKVEGDWLFSSVRVVEFIEQ